MSKYVRWRERGATYFFTVVTYHRRRLFHEARWRKLLHEAYDATRARWPFEQFACVLLPDHLHCAWILPRDDDDFSTRWSFLKRTFSQAFRDAGGQPWSVSAQRREKRALGVWQPRFWEHKIRDEDELYGYRDYIHLNPVKHGYVADPNDWPFSSVHRHERLGWLMPDWTSRIRMDIQVCGEVEVATPPVTS